MVYNLRARAPRARAPRRTDAMLCAVHDALCRDVLLYIYTLAVQMPAHGHDTRAARRRRIAGEVR
jgi:hypothetical protein